VRGLAVCTAGFSPSVWAETRCQANTGVTTAGRGNNVHVVTDACLAGEDCFVKAKFHYASWFGAGSERVRSSFGARSKLVGSLFGASSELASVMEFGFYYFKIYTFIHSFYFSVAVYVCLRTITFELSDL